MQLDLIYFVNIIYCAINSNIHAYLSWPDDHEWTFLGLSDQFAKILVQPILKSWSINITYYVLDT